MQNDLVKSSEMTKEKSAEYYLKWKQEASCLEHGIQWASLNVLIRRRGSLLPILGIHLSPTQDFVNPDCNVNLGNHR